MAERSRLSEAGLPASEPTPTGGRWLVETRQVVKRYGRLEAVRGVSMRLPPGQIVGLVGPNGSGKSTLLRLIAGLLRPDAGEVLVMGRRPGLESKGWVAFQPEIDHLYPWMTVRRVMDLAAVVVPDWDEGRARELLRLFHLEEHQQTPVRALSRGMRARLKLAVTMARTAPVVLLDEPLSGIDPPSRSRIIRALIEQFRTGEQLVVLATHEVAETEGIFDRVIFMDHGRIRLDDDAQALRERFGRSIQAIMEEVYA
ncbi:MAG TPA: ABC transporter ATP-binding protein [Limnochordales bacterium]